MLYLAETNLCNSSTPPSPPSWDCFPPTFSRLQGALRSGALPQNTMATYRATTSYWRTKWSKLLEQISIADPQTALLLFNLFFPPAMHQCIFFFFPFPLGYFSSPVEHSSRLSLVHTVPLSHFYMSNYRVCAVCSVYICICILRHHSPFCPTETWPKPVKPVVCM